MWSKEIDFGKHFQLEEFVPKTIHDWFGDDAVYFVSEWQVEIAKDIRAFFDAPVVINDWVFGGDLHYRGYRPPFAKVGASRSMHKLAGAIDFHVVGWPIKEVWGALTDLNLHDYWYAQGIRRIEHIKHTPTWVHIDNKDIGIDKIIVFHV